MPVVYVSERKLGDCINQSMDQTYHLSCCTRDNLAKSDLLDNDRKGRALRSRHLGDSHDGVGLGLLGNDAAGLFPRPNDAGKLRVMVRVGVAVTTACVGIDPHAWPGVRREEDLQVGPRLLPELFCEQGEEGPV